MAKRKHTPERMEPARAAQRSCAGRTRRPVPSHPLTRSPPRSTRGPIPASGRVKRLVGAPRGALAAGHIHAPQENYPDNEEGHDREDAEAAGAGH